MLLFKKVNSNVKKRNKLHLALAAFLIAFPFGCSAVDSWPGSNGTVIATLSDASGAVWHEGRQSLFVVQNSGRLDEIDTNGNLLDYWDLGGDLEGVTLTESSRYLYIGVENPDSIVEFDLQTEALTGKSWNLTAWMTGPDNSGLEGLAYKNGYFYAGLQADGKIYVFNVNLNVSGTVSYVETVTPYGSYTDIAGIDYSSDTGITYAIFDTANALIELNSNNEIVNHYSLPGSAQEGIAVKTNCLARLADVYIANDDNGQVVKYTNYPITCLDADSDGVTYATDCNDYDASISANRTYYRDADGDGLGSDTITSACSLAAPAGYVSNSDDQNDDDFDNDGVSTDLDCDAANNSLSQMVTYYRDADLDGLGDAATSTRVCSTAVPEGYVTDNNDPLDLVSNGHLMYINGTNYTFFESVPTIVVHTTLNYFNDDYQEVIAVGLLKKKAIIAVARVKGNEVTITRRAIKKKYKSVRIVSQIRKNKFTTVFNGRKKFTWKIKNSGWFGRSR